MTFDQLPEQTGEMGDAVAAAGGNWDDGDVRVVDVHQLVAALRAAGKIRLWEVGRDGGWGWGCNLEFPETTAVAGARVECGRTLLATMTQGLERRAGLNM